LSVSPCYSSASGGSIQQLYPVTQYWSPQTGWKAGSYNGQNDMAIVIPLPSQFQPHLNLTIQTQWFPVNLENETIQPIVGGEWNCNALVYPHGHVYFEIHGIDSSGNDELIDYIPLSSLSLPPTYLQVYDVSKYTHFYFKINVINAYHSGYWGYCAAKIVPVGFVVRGTLPPPSQNVNVQAYVYNVQSGAPVPNATVTLTDPYGYVNMQKTTGSNGIAYFNNVPFSPADTYCFSVTASHYVSSSVSYSGKDLASNNYTVRIPLTPEKPTALSAVESFAKVAGVTLIAVGVAAAGLAVYKALKERGK